MTSHGALYIPTPRNAMDASLPEFKGGKSPIEACSCNNGKWRLRRNENRMRYGTSVDSTDRETDNLACGGRKDVRSFARRALRRREK